MSEDQKLDALLAAIDQLKCAFGAPGDYGYGTREGDALFALYKARAEFPPAIRKRVPGTSHEGQNIAPFRQNSALNESETGGC